MKTSYAREKDSELPPISRQLRSLVDINLINIESRNDEEHEQGNDSQTPKYCESPSEKIHQEVEIVTSCDFNKHK